MAGNAGSGKKPAGGFFESLKNFLNGKPRDSSTPLMSTGTYIKILIVLSIVAVVLIGVVFAISYMSYTAETNPTPSVAPTSAPTPVPTPVLVSAPTPVPTPASSAVTKGAVSSDVHVVGGESNAVSTSEKITASERWTLNSTQYVPNGLGTSYLTLYLYDTTTNLLIFVDKFVISNDTGAVVNTYPAGTYMILVSNDESSELSNGNYSPYVAQLSTPTSGKLFVSATDDSYIPQDSSWKNATTLNLDKGMWKFHEVMITVTLASAKQIAANGEWNTFTIQYPWRIVWKITDGGDTSSPYTNAEFILYAEDGSIVDTFGWKGFYSSKTPQTTKVYQPGEYVLAIYQRGCGISLQFQTAQGPVYFENETVISTEGV